jgi:hypothetical protein
MKAFHGKLSVKKKYLARVKAHRLADQIVKGTYWAEGKGCAVGCTVHSGKHASYETELGIPEWLARLEDALFEGMPDEDAQKWPETFLAAIPVGADLEPIKAKILMYILKSSLRHVDAVRFPRVVAVIENVIKLYKSGTATAEDFAKARQEAYDGAYAAAYASDAAVYAADAADATAYTYAAYAAASAAAYAVYTYDACAASAAAAAASSAANASAYATRATARKEEYKRFATYLLKLLRVAKPAKKISKKRKETV